MTFFADPVAERLNAALFKVGPAGYTHGWVFHGTPGTSEHIHAVQDLADRVREGGGAPNAAQMVEAAGRSMENARPEVAHSALRTASDFATREGHPEYAKDIDAAAESLSGLKNPHVPATPGMRPWLVPPGRPMRTPAARPPAVRGPSGDYSAARRLRDAQAAPSESFMRGVNTRDYDPWGQPKKPAGVGAPSRDPVPMGLLVNAKRTAAGMSPAELRAADTELSRRAAVLGKPGQVSATQRAVRAELARRG